MGHITEGQRYTISVMLAQGDSRKEICAAIRKDKSVLSRELKRNNDKRSEEYRYMLAQRKYANQMLIKRKRKRSTWAILANEKDLIEEDYSPEKRAGYCKE